jgi:membrane protein DedA with SNARE-associated domain
MGDLLSTLAQGAVNLVYTLGYLGLFIVVMLANLHVTIPSEMTLPLAGFLIGQGRFSFFPVLATSTAAAVVGAVAHYLLGYWLGEERLRQIIRRIERFKIVTESDLDKVSEMFDRHGGKAIVIAHLIPGIGSLISVPPGLKGMAIYGRFLIYTLIGSALWNAIFIVLGWMLGSWWSIVEPYVKYVKYAVAAVAVVGIVWFLGRRLLSWLTPPEKSQTEIITLVFVNRLMELHPDSDREELYREIMRRVWAAVEANNEAQEKETPEEASLGPIPGHGKKMYTDLVIETFIDKIKELHPALDRGTFHRTVKGYVHEAVRTTEAKRKRK